MLDLSENRLSGPIPSQLVQLSLLQTLGLSYNPFKLVTIPSYIKLFLSNAVISSYTKKELYDDSMLIIPSYWWIQEEDDEWEGVIAF